MKSFQQAFKDRIDMYDGTAVINEEKYKQIQQEAFAEGKSMSDPFGNLLGGRGVCPYCNAAVNNVSYHREHQCEHRPEAVEDRFLRDLDNQVPRREVKSQTLNEIVDEVIGKEQKPTKPEPKGLSINCDCCDKPLTQPGALLFSPPYKTQSLTEKYHVCTSCYERICETMDLPFNFPNGGHD